MSERRSIRRSAMVTVRVPMKLPKWAGRRTLVSAPVTLSQNSNAPKPQVDSTILKALAAPGAGRSYLKTANIPRSASSPPPRTSTTPISGDCSG